MFSVRPSAEDEDEAPRPTREKTSHWYPEGNELKIVPRRSGGRLFSVLTFKRNSFLNTWLPFHHFIKQNSGYFLNDLETLGQWSTNPQS